MLSRWKSITIVIIRHISTIIPSFLNEPVFWKNILPIFWLNISTKFLQRNTRELLIILVDTSIIVSFGLSFRRIEEVVLRQL
jgi:hypothetical protein